MVLYLMYPVSYWKTHIRWMVKNKTIFLPEYDSEPWIPIVLCTTIYRFLFLERMAVPKLVVRFQHDAIQICNRFFHSCPIPSLLQYLELQKRKWSFVFINKKCFEPNEKITRFVYMYIYFYIHTQSLNGWSHFVHFFFVKRVFILKLSLYILKI